jgi:predicted nucleic acid-binding protein
MQVFDASSMIHAWDNYPPRQFPGLWEWIAGQIVVRELRIPRVAYAEIAHKVPECNDWLGEQDVELLDVNNEIVQDAVRIKELLGIVNDNYHPKGVDENDLLIIATARAYGAELVSDESRQKLPDIAKKRKIPVVCAMDEVTVASVNFLEYIKRSNVIFR